ncbi:MAG: rane protein [Phenylobacterium sp.]|nr:rane protein [Phenylobacterium sp.]
MRRVFAWPPRRGRSAAVSDSAEGRTAALGAVRRIYRNLGRLVSGKAGAGVISLVYMLIAVRALGPRDYGVLVLVHTFAITVGGIIEFPGWHAVVRYGARALEDDDESRLLRLLRFAALVEAAGGLCSVVTAAVLGPWLGPRLGWSPTAVAFALPYSLAVLATIRATPAGYLQLVGRFDLLGAHVLVSPVLRLLGAALLAVFGGGLRGFLIVWLVAALAEWASMWALGLAVARSRLKGRRLLGSARGAVAENPGIWRFMIAANADLTLSDLAPRITPLAVGWILGPTAAGLYAVAQRATAIISQPAQLLGQAAYAEFARLVAGGGRGRPIREALVRSVAVALAVAVPALAIIALAAHPLAALIGGQAFRQAGDVMFLLAAARAILLVGPPASSALVALGRPGLSVTANLVSSVALLPLLPPLMMWQGLSGAGLHAIIQALGGAGLLTWFVVRESRERPA